MRAVVLETPPNYQRKIPFLKDYIDVFKFIYLYHHSLISIKFLIKYGMVDIREVPVYVFG